MGRHKKPGVRAKRNWQRDMDEAARRLGRHGGMTTLKKHGREHYSEASHKRWGTDPNEKKKIDNEKIKAKVKKRRVKAARNAATIRWKKEKPLGVNAHQKNRVIPDVTQEVDISPIEVNGV